VVWETSGLRLVVWRLVHYRQTVIPWANKISINSSMVWTFLGLT